MKPRALNRNVGPHKMKLIASLVVWFMLTGIAYAGAWGEGSFDNDDALDWVAECVKSATPAPVLAAVDAAVRSKYVEAPAGSAAVAAAEVVAAALGKPSSNMLAELRAWIQLQSS